MIQLFKGPKPQILIDFGQQWTEELMQCVRNGINIPESIKGKYRHQEIKISVMHETNCKCAYCESHISHQYPGDIEHIIPKSKYPRLTFTWNNLSYACYWCNNHKKDYIDKNCKLLNPYKDNIGEHLRAFGPLIMHINNSKRGELTHKKIKLNRIELVERRIEALQELQNLIDKYRQETVVALKEILYNELLDSCLPHKEFSCCKKQYLMDQGII